MKRTAWPRLLVGMGLGALVPTVVLVGAARMPQQLQSTLLGRPECPHDWPFKADQWAENGPNLKVPEFNDCQRFIVRGSSGELVYDSLFAIFAAETLAVIQRRAPEARQGPPSLGDIRRYITTGTAMVAATIYAEGWYPPLGIEPGKSCLFIFRREDDSLGAKMVHVASVNGECPTNPLNAQGTLLEVHLQTSPSFLAQDFPPVARWDWHDSTATQYIGFGCAAAWCVVARPANLPRDQLGPGTDRTRSIRGWYDEQWLARYVNDKPWPSAIRGLIYPDPDLDGRPLSAYDNAWLPVARVALQVRDTTGLGAYKQRFNYDTIAGADSFNIISLCHGDRNVALAPASACAMPYPGSFLNTGAAIAWRDSVEARLATCVNGGDWWARIEGAAGGDPRYYCVTRRPASNYFDDRFRTIPGTARWRWMATDEGTWTACGSGCCEEEGDVS